MKAESLNALLIDRELGELTPEAVELLENWIAEHPGQLQRAAKVRKTLCIARQTVRRFPGLGRPEANVVPFGQASRPLVPLALAACLACLLGLSSWLGFAIGRGSAETHVAVQKEKPDPSMGGELPKRNGPWAQYTLASSPHGGLTVVRNDKHN